MGAAIIILILGLMVMPITVAVIIGTVQDLKDSPTRKSLPTYSGGRNEK